MAVKTAENKTTSIRETFKEMQESVEAIKNDATQRFPEAASVGEYMRQGDLYIKLIDSVPSNAKRVLVQNDDLQLAPGATKGSRHILDAADGVLMYRFDNPTALQGPIIEISQERTITHPEHGNITLNAGQIYAITYQRMHAKEVKRVLD